MRIVRLVLLVAVVGLLVGCDTVRTSDRDIPPGTGFLQPLPPPPGDGAIYARADGRRPWGIDHNEPPGVRDRVPDTVTAPIVAESGAQFARVRLGWADVEPRRERYDWAAYDRVYAELTRRRVRPVWLLAGTPSLAVRRDERGNCRGVTCSAEPDDEGLVALERLGRRLQLRYPLSAAVEYRNEPNLTDRPPYRVAPGRYVLGLRALRRGIIAGGHSIRVWGGALAAAPSARPWLREFLERNGHLSLDALSVHPYDIRAPYRGMRNLLSIVDEELARAGDGARTTRLVISEIGADDRTGQQAPGDGGLDFRDGPTDPDPTQDPGVTETVFERLARQLRDIQTSSPATPLSERVDAVMFFTTFTFASYTTTPEIAGYGWVRRPTSPSGRFTPKDVWCRFRTTIAGLPRFRGSTSLDACPAAR